MQILMHAKRFRTAFCELGVVQDEVLIEFRKVLNEEYTLSQEPIDPRNLYSAFNRLNPQFFDVKVQQDPDEALLAVYSIILKATASERPDMLPKFNLFEFIYARDVFCSDRSVEPTSTVLVQENKVVLTLPFDLGGRGIAVDLYAQLKTHFASELVEDLELCQRRPGMVATRMATAPKLLLLLVQRNFHGLAKNNIPVSYPYFIHAIPGVEGARYTLSGVVHHRGPVSNSGHYTADFLHPDSGGWYEADDSRVVPIRAPENPSRAAYLFIYEKVE